MACDNERSCATLGHSIIRQRTLEDEEEVTENCDVFIKKSLRFIANFEAFRNRPLISLSSPLSLELSSVRKVKCCYFFYLSKIKFANKTYLLSGLNNWFRQSARPINLKKDVDRMSWENALRAQQIAERQIYANNYRMWMI